HGQRKQNQRDNHPIGGKNHNWGEAQRRRHPKPIADLFRVKSVLRGNNGSGHPVWDWTGLMVS
ncbi:MAG: hypothetical protein ACOY17_03930, partial [Pseudomonadota bacterium]